MNTQKPIVGNPNRPKINLIGQKFYSLTVLSHFYKRIGKNNKVESFAECRCDCGNIINTITQNVKRGLTKSCGCLRKINSNKKRTSQPKKFKSQPLLNIIGQKYGLLTVLGQSREPRGLTQAMVSVAQCLCDCGVKKEVRIADLRNKTATSCGCSKRGKNRKLRTDNKTHGMAGTSIYQTWASMVSRCADPKFRRYEGRGIKVCDRWLKFKNFYEDTGDRPEGLELDRIDNNKGYSKENCRWITRSENMSNTCRSKYWFINGVRYESLRDASDDLNKSIGSIKNWCDGYISTSGNKLPPRKNCWSELKY